MEKRAQKFFYSERLEEAMTSYHEILTIDPDHAMANYRLAICSLLVYPRSTAMNQLLQYKSTQGKKDKFYNYWLGRAFFHQQQFRKAIDTWSRFLSLTNYKSAEIIAEVEYRMAWAERAEHLYSHAENYEIEQLPEPINNEATQLSPIYVSNSDELLFFSLKKETAHMNEEKYQVFATTRTDDTWSDPTLVDHFGEFLSSHVGLEWMESSRCLYFYKGDKKGELFYIRKANDHWGTPNSMGDHISKIKPNAPVFINAAQDRILFSVRKKGNSVDLDLFESRKKPNTDDWSKPTLLSPVLSSDQDEDFAFLTSDENTLYFGSKGFNSIGGYDIFKTEWESATQTWSEPQNLGYPINSIDDDIQFTIDPITNSGYLASNRLTSRGNFDVYFFYASDKVLLSGEVLDANGTPAKDAEIHFYPIDPSSMETLKSLTDKQGLFEVSVPSDDSIRLEVYFSNEKVYEQAIKTPKGRGVALTMHQKIDIGKTHEEEAVDLVDEDPHYGELEDIGSKFRVSNKALLSNIYFDFGKYNLDAEDQKALAALLQIMQENKNLRIEIAGHTDALGDGYTNLRLSILRAQSVANYLVSMGIAPDRVVAKGYGYAIPLASNDQEKEGRELNRRIEVLVLE